MYSEELENLIEAIVIDGEITEKERKSFTSVPPKRALTQMSWML